MGKKRKLDEQDVPSEPEAKVEARYEEQDTTANGHTGAKNDEVAVTADPGVDALAATVSKASFKDLGLDPRLLQAIAKEKYASPTSVQVKAIPHAISGKDVLARAKTGSGKTAAYILPILQAILRRKSQNRSANSSRGGGPSEGTAALILVPTRELASQVTKSITTLSAFCAKEINAVDLTPQISDQAQRAVLSSNVPDIVVATPTRAATHLRSAALGVENLTHLVVDEADLVLSYEYGKDVDDIVKLLPRGVQSFLASATLTTEVETLKRLFCRDPVVLDLSAEEAKETGESVAQYVVWCAEDEKFLLAFALFKLKLVKGKCIVFVADVDRCYRVKLFLEQFGIKSCVLNSELPVNCRIHVVEEFNKGVYDIIIATDEKEMAEYDQAGKGEENGVEADAASTKTEAKDDDHRDKTADVPAVGKKKKKKEKLNTHKKDETYGISRGIDFHAVTCVLNFDMPKSAKSYIHRIGRTARAGRTGIALTFAIPKAQYGKHKPTSHPSASNDEIVVEKISRSQNKRSNIDTEGEPQEKSEVLKPYRFDMKKLEGFRYRISSALKVVSPGAVRAARLRELREEMLRSERLRRHLEENPADKEFLRHDGELRPKKVLPHLRHVPEYLMPSVGGDAPGTGGVADGLARLTGEVSMAKTQENRIRKARERNRLRGKGARKGGPSSAASRGKKVNPLKTFNAGRK